jgi:hypothetical protein
MPSAYELRRVFLRRLAAVLYVVGLAVWLKKHQNALDILVLRLPYFHYALVNTFHVSFLLPCCASPKSVGSPARIQSPKQMYNDSALCNKCENCVHKVGFSKRAVQILQLVIGNFFLLIVENSVETVEKRLVYPIYRLLKASFKPRFQHDVENLL